jgi:molybdenum cofactor synthesis domain-containing protein
VATAVVLTIGNELVSGDVENTNASWLARRLETLGVHVELIAAVPDVVDLIADFVRTHAARTDVLVVTGGLGGTPDDLTREALAASFGVEQVVQDDVAGRLRERFHRDPEYAARWAELPAGARALENPLGGAPGFVLENVYVLPGLPAEMEAMFDMVADELRSGSQIASWRRTYRTTESQIVGVLREAEERHPTVLVGSYPSFHPHGGEVEVVVKASDPQALGAASAWIEKALERALKT